MHSDPPAPPQSRAPIPARGPDESGPSPRKKRKSLHSKKNRELPPCHLTSLPFELVAEILLYTGSPRAVLAVARTCKHLCATLQMDSSGFIWKYVRENCAPRALPEPPPEVSESTYAALVFDEGTCEVCRRPSRSLPTSYSLRLYVCPNRECVSKFRERLLTEQTRQSDYIQIVRDALPHLEASPVSSLWFRQADYRRAMQRYMDVASDIDAFEKHLQDLHIKARHWKSRMTFYVSLSQWKEEYVLHLSMVREKNKAFLKQLATNEKTTDLDLLNSQAFGPVVQMRQKAGELITQKDFEVCRINVEPYILRIDERRKRRNFEANYRDVRSQIESYHPRLRSDKRHTPLPTLSIFRELPVVKMILGTVTSDVKPEVAKELDAGLGRRGLERDLQSWRGQVRKALAAELGEADWAPGKKDVLHPVERLTARFACARCMRIEARYRPDECFDFAGVCGHQCALPHNTNKPKELKVWKVEVFKKDEKACKAAQALLDACQIDAASPQSDQKLAVIGRQIRCLSCKDAQIVMWPEDVIGHSHRHDEMQLEVLESAPEPSAWQRRPDRKTNATQQLMYPDRTTKEIVDVKLFGCHHCPWTALEKFEEAKQHLLGFNGVRSHLKAKHGVDQIRDEDFYRVDDATYIVSLQPKIAL